MTSSDIYNAISGLRAAIDEDDVVLEKMCNYVEANIDDFLECYEDVELNLGR